MTNELKNWKPYNYQSSFKVNYEKDCARINSYIKEKRAAEEAELEAYSKEVASNLDQLNAELLKELKAMKF